jgi:long-chain fatty acid transport protein
VNNKHNLYGIFFILCAASSQALASDFSLPFVNSSSLGVAYADWATAAADASTAYTNPAGLVYLPHQQLVINALGIAGTAQFTGTAVTPPYPYPNPIIQSGKARTNIKAFSPSFYYALPFLNKLAFGFNFTAPFGLGTKYPSDPFSGITRYAATRSEVLGLDASPSLAIKLNDWISLGAGFDVLHLAFTLNNRYGPPVSSEGDAVLQNHLSGWGYGWHGGILIAFAPSTRLGLSYNSQIGIVTRGYSKVTPVVSTPFRTEAQKTKAALPGRAQISLQHDFTPRWTAMATAFYTNWRVFKEITMENTQLPDGKLLSVTIPFNYHNCFDYSAGAAFKANEKLLLRAGIEFMNTPSNDQDRGVADPIGSATILTVGAHFQADERVGFDLGVGHSFFKQMPINFANDLTRLQGHTNTQTTVIGGQINCNIS